MIRIHPTAVIDPSAHIGQNVTIGPYTCIGPDCSLGDNVVLGPHVTVTQNTRIGNRTMVHSHACLGGDPQDVSYKGETTWLTIGEDVQIREFVTLHRASTAGQSTTIGNGCLLMTSVHVGHDSQVGNHVIIASSTVLAGHVTIGDHAFVSGLCAIHQHCRIGAYSMIGGVSATRQDIPPFCRSAGVPSILVGLNSVGLRRQGIPAESRMALKRAYKTLWLQGLNLSQAIELLDASEEALDPYVQQLLAFVRVSNRGIVGHGKEAFRSLDDPYSGYTLADMIDADSQRVLTQHDAEGLPQ
jgi:UDP-N-acetylglucosamine acyltransferase